MGIVFFRLLPFVIFQSVPSSCHLSFALTCPQSWKSANQCWLLENAKRGRHPCLLLISLEGNFYLLLLKNIFETAKGKFTNFYEDFCSRYFLVCLVLPWDNQERGWCRCSAAGWRLLMCGPKIYGASYSISQIWSSVFVPADWVYFSSSDFNISVG